MKKILYTIFSLLLGTLSYSQFFKDNKYNSSNSEIIHYNNKYGLMDSNHTWIIKPIYEGLYAYSSWWESDKKNIFDSKGFLLASIKGKYGFIDEKETVKIPFIFNSLTNFDKNGNAIASIYDIYSNNEKYGIINRTGNWVLKPIYQYINPYSNDNIYDNKGYLLVKINNKFGFIDKNNKNKISFLFDRLSYFDDKGFAIAYPCQITYEDKDVENNITRIRSDNKCGVINRNGNWIVSPIYHNIEPYSENKIFDSKGFLRVQMGPEMDYVYRFLDNNGKLLELISKSDIKYFFYNNFINNLTKVNLCKQNENDYNLTCKSGIVDRKGNFIVPAVYNDLSYDSSIYFPESLDQVDFILAEKDNKWGFIDIKNEIKIPFKFDNLTKFDVNGYSIAELKDSIYNDVNREYDKFIKSGIIDRKGNWLLNPDYDNISAYRDSVGFKNSYKDHMGFLLVKKNNKFGFLGNDFKIEIPFIFDFLDYFDDQDYACACIESKNAFEEKACGFINRKGKWIIEPKFQLVRSFNRIGVALVIINNKRRYINRQGQFILELDKHEK